MTRVIVVETRKEAYKVSKGLQRKGYECEGNLMIVCRDKENKEIIIISKEAWRIIDM